MITAVDTNIFLDILIPDENYYFNSKQLLDEHVERGQLIISEIVYAELASLFLSEKELRTFLSDTGTELVYSGEKRHYVSQVTDGTNMQKIRNARYNVLDVEKE
ncbi:MAG: type II toxin-antitoxin system VapC family toxin [Candidatus Brocadia sp.]|nr:type II toxin-antitoxin system VapC family toxin [Candidatus Brocadia sp.]UJS17326.1 MAG: type II toxin-antitoxin system VapC family toxin [Candidatus Jettenia sp.]